VNAIGKGEQIK